MSRGRGSGSASAVTTTSWLGVGDDDPLDGVVVVGSPSQHRLPRGDLDDAREGPVGAAGVADDADPVADDDALAAERPGLHRRHGPVVDAQGVAAAVDGQDERVLGVVVRRPLLGARASVPTWSLVVLLVVLVVATAHGAVFPHLALQQPGPVRREVGEGLDGGGDVLDEHAVDGRTEDHAGVRHPVVGVGAEDAAVQRGRAAGSGRRRARSRRRRGGRARSPGPRGGRSRGRGCGRCRAGATASRRGRTGRRPPARARRRRGGRGRRRCSWSPPVDGQAVPRRARRGTPSRSGSRAAGHPPAWSARASRGR